MTSYRPNLFPANEKRARLILLQGVREGRAAHTYPDLKPRPSIRGCGTSGILPLRAAVKRKKWTELTCTTKPVLRPMLELSLVPFSMYGDCHKLDVPASAGPRLEIGEYEQDQEQRVCARKDQIRRPGAAL